MTIFSKDIELLSTVDVVDDCFESHQQQWPFDHENEHKPDRRPFWIDPKHNDKRTDVSRDESQKDNPEHAASQITLELSAKNPHQSAGPKTNPNHRAGM